MTKVVRGAQTRPDTIIKHLKKTTCMTTALIVLSGFVPQIDSVAWAGPEDTAQLGVHATIVRAMALDVTRPLEFGRFAVDASSGALALGVNGNITQAVNARSHTQQINGGIVFNATPGVAFSVQAPELAGEGHKLYTQNGLAHITVTKIVIGADENGLTDTVTLGAGANAQEASVQGAANAANPVGGGLQWKGGAPQLGKYSGTITIEIHRI